MILNVLHFIICKRIGYDYYNDLKTYVSTAELSFRLFCVMIIGYYFTSQVLPLRRRSSTHCILDLALTSAT